MTSSELDSVLDFLGTTAKQGYVNDNTALGRRTACVKLFTVLDDDQKTVAYVRDNMDAIKTRFQNLNKDVRGGTVDEYARRVLFSVNDYMKWMADRGAWEREAGSRGKAASDGDKKAKAPKAEKQAPIAAVPAPVANTTTRMVAIPIRPDFDVSTVIPKDITIHEVRKIAYVLAGMVVNHDPTTKAVQDLLDFKDGNQGMNG